MPLAVDLEVLGFTDFFLPPVVDGCLTSFDLAEIEPSPAFANELLWWASKGFADYKWAMFEAPCCIFAIRSA